MILSNFKDYYNNFQCWYYGKKSRFILSTLVFGEKCGGKCPLCTPLATPLGQGEILELVKRSR